jgi:hypothetical protein
MAKQLDWVGDQTPQEQPAAAAIAMSGKPTGNCTECQWGYACGVVHPGIGMLAEDKDGSFCLRCGHAPGCHKPIACEVCNGSGGIASACRCPECQNDGN